MYLQRLVWRGILKCQRRKRSHVPPVVNSGPLKGIRVLDFSRVLAGPYASQILGDMGAEVIKVESIDGDDTRKWGPPFAKGYESAYFISLNRNKLSIILNMKHPAVKKVVVRLIERSDVLIENFIEGTAEKLGIGYDDVSKINNRIIYCSVTGFGSTGPFAKKPGYDAIISAMYGMMHITGDEGGAPVKPGVAVTDVLTGLLAHGAILSALYERTISGKGQRVDTSLMEAQLSSLVNVASNYLITGQDNTQRLGTAHPSIVPYQAFSCKDGKYISLAVGNDRQFEELCKALGREDWSRDKRFLTNADRVNNRDILIPAIAELLATKELVYWLAEFETKTFPFGPVRSIAESFTCEQAVQRNMIEVVVHPKCGPVKVVGVPVKYSRTPSSIRLAPPLVGEHTRAVLKDLLGFHDSEIDDLINEGAVDILKQPETL